VEGEAAQALLPGALDERARPGGGDVENRVAAPVARSMIQILPRESFVNSRPEPSPAW
jgi:hypothetical protein